MYFRIWPTDRYSILNFKILIKHSTFNYSPSWTLIVVSLSKHWFPCVAFIYHLQSEMNAKLLIGIWIGIITINSKVLWLKCPSDKLNMSIEIISTSNLLTISSTWLKTNSIPSCNIWYRSFLFLFLLLLLISLFWFERTYNYNENAETNARRRATRKSDQWPDHKYTYS